MKNMISDVPNKLAKFNRTTMVAIAAGSVLALGGVGFAVTKTIQHQRYSKKFAPHNAPIVRAGQAGPWVYRCIYTPEKLKAGPSVCGMEHAIYAHLPQNKDPVQFGSVFISHATQNPAKLALRDVPWFLSVMIKAGIDPKVPAQLVLSRKETIAMNWKSCGKSGCSAETVLSKQQVDDLLSAGERELHITPQGNSAWTIKVNFAGSGPAMDNLVEWSSENPFK